MLVDAAQPQSPIIAKRLFFSLKRRLPAEAPYLLNAQVKAGAPRMCGGQVQHGASTGPGAAVIEASLQLGSIEEGGLSSTVAPGKSARKMIDYLFSTTLRPPVT